MRRRSGGSHVTSEVELTARERQSATSQLRQGRSAGFLGSGVESGPAWGGCSGRLAPAIPPVAARVKARACRLFTRVVVVGYTREIAISATVRRSDPAVRRARSRRWHDRPGCGSYEPATEKLPVSSCR